MDMLFTAALSIVSKQRSDLRKMLVYEVLLNGSQVRDGNSMPSWDDLGDRDYFHQKPYVGEQFDWVVNCQMLKVEVVEVIDYLYTDFQGVVRAELLFTTKRSRRARGAILVADVREQWLSSL